MVRFLAVLIVRSSGHSFPLRGKTAILTDTRSHDREPQTCCTAAACPCHEPPQGNNMACWSRTPTATSKSSIKVDVLFMTVINMDYPDIHHISAFENEVLSNHRGLRCFFTFHGSAESSCCEVVIVALKYLNLQLLLDHIFIF